jgi:uncharacterized protein
MQQYYDSYGPSSYGRSLPTSIDFAEVMRRVYSWLALGLIVGFGIAMGLAYSGSSLAFNPLVSLVSIIAYLGVGFTFHPIVQRSSVAVGATLYVIFTALFGLMISSIFLVYTASSITTTFFIASLTFGVMALLGFTTRMDLSKIGNIAFGALIGLIIAMVVNFILHSSLLYLLISCVGVILFSALTAYDVQNIKRTAITLSRNGTGLELNRLALIGAFSLFLDFVNLFLFLLRLFGRER